MYIPDFFAQRDARRIEALLREHAFGVLISNHEGRPFATHLPLLYEPAGQGKGRLLGHMARANAQWQSLEEQTVLVILQGPHAYVSPRWYTRPGVPTWNYAAVHAYGRARLITDPVQLQDLLRRLTEIYEGEGPDAWRADFESDAVRGMSAAVVGFEISIDTLEGKFKLSQNRPREDQARVREALAGSERAFDREVAGLMALTMPEE